MRKIPEMADTSFPELVKKLCEVHLGPVERALRTQPTYARTDGLRRLKKKAYNALFTFLEDRPIDKSGVKCLSHESEGISQVIDSLRSLRRQRDADRLQELKDRLLNDDIVHYLRFLVALKGSGAGSNKQQLGTNNFESTTSVINKLTPLSTDSIASMSPMPPCYGDCDTLSSTNNFYMHYPSQIFETVYTQIEQTHEIGLSEAMTLLPGEGLGEGGFFTQQFLLDNEHEQKTHCSLFGGLTQGRIEDLNSCFELPELSHSPSFSIPEFKAKKSPSYSQVSDESGVGSSGSASMSSSVMTLHPSSQSEMDPWFWVNALTSPRSYHYTWEWAGLAPGPTEKPYLTEAGQAVFDQLLKHRRRMLTIMSPMLGLISGCLTTVQPEVLIKDILLMLTGVPSPNLLFDPSSIRFHVREGLHVSGTSPEMLLDFLTEFLDCGMLFTRLSKFSQPPILNSLYTKGLVFQAFTVAVRKALMHFSACVLNTPCNLGFVQLKVYLHFAMEQIKYLAKLCCCADGIPKLPADLPVTTKVGQTIGVKLQESGDQSQEESSWTPVDKEAKRGFPTGMNLLVYLFDEANIAVNSPHYPLLLSILQTTCAPFVLFIRDWVFHGVLRDSYEEFMIKLNSTYLCSRDENYWKSAYTLDSHSMVPDFLHTIVSDIVTCGKSINLLRLCSPGHFLCNSSERDTPAIYVSYSRSVLQAMEYDCQTYLGRMQQISRQLSLSREEMMRRAEAAKLELQQTARRMADQEIARLQGIIDDRKKASQEKKKVEFARLKKQMEDDLQRKAEERLAEKEEDAMFVARIAREEEALTEEEIELEKKAREELIEYYTSLGEEAAHRERLALWKIQRARLSLQREDFLEKDSQRWGRELLSYQNKLDSISSNKSPEIKTQLLKDDDKNLENAQVVEDTPDSLPSWVLRHGDGDEDSPEEIRGSQEVQIPAWATRELPVVIEDDDDEEEEDSELKGRTPEISDSGVVLPSWVLREVEGDCSIVIDDKEEEENQSDSESHLGQQVSKPVVNITDEIKTDGIRDAHGQRLRAVKLGGTPLPKQHVKTSATVNSLVETEEAKVRPSTQIVEGKHPSAESKSSSSGKSIQMVKGASISQQTVETETRVHLRTSKSMGATTESQPEDLNPTPHLKFIKGMQVNQQSAEEQEVIPRKAKAKNHSNVSTQSLPQVWEIKKPSKFGHVSKVSTSDYTLSVPKLKRQMQQHANLESEFKDFGIKPRIRISKTMAATKESQSSSDSPSRVRPQIRMVEGRSITAESERIDVYEVSRQRFRVRNTKGHASDSSIQRLLYGGDMRVSRWAPSHNEGKDEPDAPLPKISFTSGQPYTAESYDADFDLLDDAPNVDLLSNIVMVDIGRDLVDSALASEEDVDTFKFTPLSVLMARSVTAPIKAQISLVNTAVVNYFTSDLQIDAHFAAIRRYLLMADGDFSEILANILFEKLSTNPLPQEIFNPVFLNGALTKAVRSSINSNDELAKNLSFALRSMPGVLMPNAPNSLSCLELRYEVQWPNNIILSAQCMQKYCSIFKFLLQIKRVVWTLKDVWHRLKRDALIVPGAANSPQFRHLQLYRQEMEHFVKATQGYITSQVIHVSWQEFQRKLAQPLAGLEDLQALHKCYVDSALAKCLLDKKAARVMKVIQDIFYLILKFRLQLASANWQTGPNGETTHPSFENIQHTHKSFHSYSFFLFKVVNRLSQKGYQPHLQELLLQLNFNDFYREAAS